MKYTIAVLVIAAAGAAQAGDDRGSFSNVTGAFGGNVSTMAASGGMSATGSWGGNGNTSIRNQSGAGQFSGASMGWESDVGRGDGSVSMGAESFVDGFDFSRTRSNGGYGAAASMRFGGAAAKGGFGGAFGSFDARGDLKSDNGFPGLGLGHGGFDEKPGKGWGDD